MSSGSDYVRALFIGFVFTPVFFVVINVIAYENQIFLQFKGMPIAIRDIARWLLLIPDESRRTVGIVGVTIAWLAGWLLAKSRSRNTNMTALALVTSYFLYILYLVSFWRVPVIIYIPESIIPVIVSITAIYALELIDKYRPKKTIFDRLKRIGMTFPESWKRSYNIPIKCPTCGVIIYSSPKYCWNCHSELKLEALTGET